MSNYTFAITDFQEHFFIGWINQSAQNVVQKQTLRGLPSQQMKTEDGRLGEWKLLNAQTVVKMRDFRDTTIQGNCLVGYKFSTPEVMRIKDMITQSEFS